MRKLSGNKLDRKKTICFSFFMLAALAAAVVFAAMAAEKSGMYWIGMDSNITEKPEDNRGFFMVDVSDLLSLSESASASENTETEIVPIGIGPLPSVPSLTEEELKLYGVLSRGDGLISSEDKSELDEDIHWQEVVLDEGDTLEDIAKEYGLTPAQIRKSNAMGPNDKPQYTDVLYIPDSPKYIHQTLAYVKKLQLAEIAMRKHGKPLKVTAYVVQNGDTLWSIANKFNLDLDTLVGSNKLKDINTLKPGTALRIPNQDGIFVKAGKNTNIAKLADKYGSSKEAALLANSIAPREALAPGREIFLPGAKVVAVVESSGGKRVRGGSTRTVTERVTASSSRRFRWPVMGQISSNFGWRRSPFGRRRVFHAGLDIRAPRGRGIMAAGNGRVVHSGWMSGYGKTIVISHAGGLSTLYGHCSSLLVRSGTVVRSGQLIARVGSTGRSTGNHLHFEVRRNGSPMNPIRFLR